MIACCGVDLVHVALGAVTALVLGSLWYAPFMFGGCVSTPTMPQKSIGMCFLLEFLNSSMGTWALFAALNVVGPMTLQQTLYLGLLISFASAVPAGLAKYIWKNESLNDSLIGAAFSVTLMASLITLRSYLVG